MKHLIWLLCMFILVNVCFWMEPKEYAKSLWAKQDLIDTLRDACETADDPHHCFGVWLAISNAESNMWKAKSSHWYFWLVWAKDKSATRRVQTYKRKRYKAKNGYFFYGSKGKLAPSRYCTSEHSSNSNVWCPNGAKNFDTVRNDYRTKIYEDTQDTPQWFPKKECHRVGKATKNQYIQFDSMFGQFISRLFPKEDTNIFVCDKVL